MPLPSADPADLRLPAAAVLPADVTARLCSEARFRGPFFQNKTLRWITRNVAIHLSVSLLSLASARFAASPSVCCFLTAPACAAARQRRFALWKTVGLSTISTGCQHNVQLLCIILNYLWYREPALDGFGPVQLFQNHDPGQMVGKGHGRHGQAQVRGGLQGRIHAVGAAQHKAGGRPARQLDLRSVWASCSEERRLPSGVNTHSQAAPGDLFPDGGGPPAPGPRQSPPGLGLSGSRCSGSSISWNLQRPDNRLQYSSHAER